jgi:hypothetical protein
MYERNLWAGVRTPATYAGLAAAYRDLGRDDLAEVTLEQVRLQGGAGGASDSTPAAQAGATTITPRRSRPRPAPRSGRWADIRRTPEPRAGRASNAYAGVGRDSQAPAEGPAGDVGVAIGQLPRSIAPFLAGQAGRRTLVVSTVILPIALGLGIFAAVVLTSARPRAADQAPPATPTPPVAEVATPAATAAATLAIPAALAVPPAPARLIVDNVGTDGLSLRRAPGPTGQRIKVWNAGTEMADLGETTETDGITWRKVRDPEGNVGWTAAEYLADPAARAVPAAGPPFASGGLGLSRAEWEKIHGGPTRSSILLEYDDGRLVVGLLESNVWHLERVWMRGDAEAVSLEAAREEAKSFLPSDATETQTVDRGDGRIIDVYSSAILANRFASTAWNGGTQGTFAIQYRFRSAADRMVTSAMFRLGDTLF